MVAEHVPGKPDGDRPLYFAAVAPLLVWDVIRNRRVHEAYLVWAAIYLPASLLMYRLWDTPLWHATAQGIMRV